MALEFECKSNDKCIAPACSCPRRKVTTFRCNKCDSSFVDGAPLFGKNRACDIQGCAGVAIPDQPLSPSGIRKINDTE